MVRRDHLPATTIVLCAALLCWLLVDGRASGQTNEPPSALPNGPATGPTANPAQDPLALPISIRGVVEDESGKRVTNAQIEEIGHAWRHERLSAQSNAAGRFTLASRIPNFPRQLLARDDAGGRLGSVNCAFSESAEPLRIVVRKAREIVVNVNDSRGRPVPDATVAAVGWGSAATIAETQTDASGAATLRVAPDLTLYCVFALKNGEGFDYSIPQPAGPPSAPRGRAAAEIPPVKLVLDGAQRLRVHVVDENRAPLAGVRIRAAQIRRPGKAPLSGIDELAATTDAAGNAEIRTLPVKREAGLIVVSDPPVYSFGGPPMLNRTAPVCDVQLIAHPSTSMHVLVTLADGRPVPGAKISSSFRYESGIGFGNSVTFGDEEGLSQLPGFQHDAVGIASAEVGHFASPIAGFIAHKGQPIPLIHLVVRPAARVHGTVTYGKGRRPLAEATVTLHQRDERVAESAPSRHPSEVAGTEISRSVTTDRQGRFEFFAAPGRYSIAIGPPVYVQVIAGDMTGKSVSLEGGAKELEIKDQGEIELNFANARPPLADFVGHVVLESDRKQGVGEATVHVAPVDPQNEAGFRPVRTDADGAFHAQRRPCEMLVEAETDDGSSSGLVRVFADEANVTIPIGPGASVRGVILDATTGRPVVNQRIICGIRLDFPQGGFRLAAPRGAVTNRQGEFELSGLPRGWKFECYAQVGARGQPVARYVPLGEITTDTATTIDLGKINLPAPRVAPPADSKKPL